MPRLARKYWQVTGSSPCCLLFQTICDKNCCCVSAIRPYCRYQDRSVLSDAECAQIVASQTSGWPRVVSFGNTTIGCVSCMGRNPCTLGHENSLVYVSCVHQIVRLRYRLHEWGRPTKQPLQFSSWPGFTFNPSVWDLRYLQNLLGIPVASHFAANGALFAILRSMPRIPQLRAVLETAVVRAGILPTRKYYLRLVRYTKPSF